MWKWWGLGRNGWAVLHLKRELDLVIKVAEQVSQKCAFLFGLPYKSPWRWQFTWFDRRFRGAGETMTFWRQKSCVIKVGPHICSWISGHLGYEIDKDSDDNLTLAIKRGSWIQSGDILPNGEILRKSRPKVISNSTQNPFFSTTILLPYKVQIHPYFVNGDLKRKKKAARNQSTIYQQCTLFK